jgi:two-component system, chemotaxis family, protein-glutamate methylesterase/glutaminase
VAGTAANARIALARVAQLAPDVVLLGSDPEADDGPEELAAVRDACPGLPVLRLDRHRPSAGPPDAGEALALPALVAWSGPALASFRVRLLARLRTLARRGRGEVVPPGPRARPSAMVLPRRVELIALGASTGGPNALAALLPALPADCPVPVVVVQHMPPVFTGHLAARLGALGALPVAEAVDGAALAPGQAWLAPGDHHLAVARDAAGGGRMRLHQGPPENSCRPAVDVLLRSAAESYGPGVLAVVLTGMGQDGLRGCEHVRAAGGQVVVQDEASSVVWGMPGHVARAGLADAVLPLEEIGPEVLRRARLGRSCTPPRPRTGHGLP